MNSTAPGWHRDPAEPDTQRYWDGEQWLGERLPLGIPTPSGPLQPPPAQASPVQPPMQPSTASTVSTSPAPARIGDTGSAEPAAILAPVEQRLLARLIDVGVVFALNVVLNGYFVFQLLRELQPTLSQVENGESPFSLTYSSRANTLALIIQVVALALWFAYEVPAIAATGQTLGKRVMGIRVIGSDGRPIGFRRSILRWLPPGVCFLVGLLAAPFMILDSLWCTWDKPRRQCLHDKVAATLVIGVNSGPNSTEAP